MLRPDDLRLQDNDKILEQAKELISREIKLCKTLRAMISRELEAIVLNADMDELADVLAKKDDIIAELQLLTDGWQDIIHSMKPIPQGVNMFNHLLELYPDDSELPALIQETHDISNSIMKAEDDAISELEKYRTDLRSQMVKRVNNKNAAASYARMGGSII